MSFHEAMKLCLWTACVRVSFASVLHVLCTKPGKKICVIVEIYGKEMVGITWHFCAFFFVCDYIKKDIKTNKQKKLKKQKNQLL